MFKLFRLTLILVLVCMLFASTSQSADSPTGIALKLKNAVTLNGVRQHLQAFQSISNANGGERASGTLGYEDSVDYVVAQLTAAGYDPQVQTFNFGFYRELTTPVLQRVSPGPETFSTPSDFGTMTYSGSGNVTAQVQEVNNNIFPAPAFVSTSHAGCAAADFAGFVAGRIALIQRGTCSFNQKAANAQAAGAVGVIIFNEGSPGRTDTLFGTLGGPGVTIPVVGVSFAFGATTHGLIGVPVIMRINVSTISEVRQTSNVLAETRDGDPNRVVVQGSALDSGPLSPGINGNGSGAAYNLESAIQLAKIGIRPRNKIRFAWWGGSINGLLGSNYYVINLSNADFLKILVELDYNTIASPNYARFVFDGDGSSFPVTAPAGTAQVERAFLDYFRSVAEPSPLDGTSDYGPFMFRGAPVGGLFAGAGDIKTANLAAIYGGTAVVAFDPCYLAACDTIANINNVALDQMSDAAATVLVLYGFTKQPVTTTTLHPPAAEGADEDEQ
jgi:Zn-dependent M28 family amino/carboxypeptidase